jgi:hypothetical protein
MSRPSPPTATAWLGLIAVAAMATLLRYRFIEPPLLAAYCVASGSAAPLWCTWRQWVVEGFLLDVYGIAAVAATALALLWRRRWSAWLAAALGALAMQLYCYETGALALLVGVLLLMRSGDATRPRHPGRGGEQDVQTQP